MDRRRAKFSKDSPKFIFAERLDALLGVGRTKPRPVLRPSTSSSFYMEPVTITSATANVPMHQHQPEMISFRPLRTSINNSSTSSATSTTAGSKEATAATTRHVNVNPTSEFNRKLLIREMIERNKASRRLSQHSTHSGVSDTLSEVTILSTTVVMGPRPQPPQPRPKPRPRELAQPQSQVGRPVQMSTSVPLLDTIDTRIALESAAASSRLSGSTSNPELLSPESPNLMDFPDSDSEDRPVHSSPVIHSTSTDSSISTATGREFANVQTQPLSLPLPGPILLIDQEIEVLTEELVGNLATSTGSDVPVEDTSNLTLDVSQPALDNSINVHPAENPTDVNTISSENDSELNTSMPILGGAAAIARESETIANRGREIPYEDEIFNLSRASSSSSGISSVSSYDSTPGGLKISDKIVWFTENGVAETGEVKWIGTINERFHAGVEFVNPVGNSSGKLKGKQLFSSALTHGRFIPVSELMFHEDYYHPPFTGNNEPSSCPNGFPQLKTQDSEEQLPFVCVICQDDLLTRNEESQDKEDVKEMLATRCGHLFHSDCLNKWFKLKTKLQQPCPYCQRIMNISDTIRIFPVQGKR